MAIRRAAPGHLPILLRFVESFYAADGHAFDEVSITRALTPLLQDDRYGVVYLIEAMGHVAGYAIVTWRWSLESGGRDALLDEMFVTDHARGLDGRAIEEIAADLKARNVPRIYLETKTSNHRARVFYEGHGFDPDDSTWMSRAL